MGRSDQPQCGNCNHTKTFHGSGKSRCKALGCQCKKWVEPKSKAS